MKPTSAFVLAALVALTGISSAAVTVSHSHVLNPYQTTFTPSSTDLINDGQATVVSVTSDYTPFNANYGQYAVLTDGIATGADSTRTLPSNRQGFTITYDLNTILSPNGYDISSIITYAGNSDGRARQEYLVFYSLVGDDTYIQLVSDSFTTDRPTGPFQTNTSTSPGAVAGGSGGETELTINISGLTGVDSIRFVTQPASGNSTSTGASVYREFDVFGTASVPEPSVFGLVGVVGAFGMLRRRR